MAVSVTELAQGRYKVTIRFRWPDKTSYRERPTVKVSTKTLAQKWGEQRERELLAKGQPKAEEKKAVDRTPKVEKWFHKFYDFKESKGLVSAKDMRARAVNYVLPIIGHKTMRSVTEEDIRKVVKELDRLIEVWQAANGARGQGLSYATATNVWGDLAHAFDEAVRSKESSLRCLEISPCVNVRGPETGHDREGPILYSDEIHTLLTGKAVEGIDVPLYRRRVYAMAIYSMARRSELAALTAEDVDLPHKTVTIDKQVDRTSVTDGTKRTKTKRTRTIDVEPHVLPLVELLVGQPEGKEGRLLRVPPAEDCAELLRKDLWTVGCRRPELHKDDAMRTKIWFHHLRDTGLTHMAVRGDSPIMIQWRGGHTTFAMTQGYLDRGRVEARRIGDPLGPIPSGLFVG